MSKLKKVFVDLNDPVYTRFSSQDASYTVQRNGRIEILKPQELLEVGRTDPREHVMIAYFGSRTSIGSSEVPCLLP